jgi:Kef-type K+ transport system membrane component KefB
MYDLGLLSIIWVSVFIAAFLAHYTRLTPVLWYLFCGAILVNIGILPETMPIFIIDFAELGIIVIMFALGFEEDSKNFIKSIKRSWGIAFFGALVPFIVAYSATYYFWGDANMSLLCGLAMTATAVSLTMVSLKTEGLSKTPAATGIMTSAVLDDIASLALVAIMIPIAAGEATLSLDGVLLIIGKAVAFFLIVTFIGGWLFPTKKGFLKRIPALKNLDLRRVLSMGKGEYTILSLLLIAVSVGLLAHEFGFHPAVGAYMAGLIIHQEYFSFNEDNDVDYYRQAREMIDNIAFSWIGPVFFVTLGTKLIFDSTLFISVLPEAILLFVGLFIGQVASAGLAARYTGNFDGPSSLMIGFGMLGRAELAFVVMDIAYDQYHILTTQAFYTLMVTTFLLNVSVPLTIRWWKVKFKDVPIET